MFGTQCLAIECCLSGFTHYNLTSITRARYCAPAAVCFVLEPEVSGAGGNQLGPGRSREEDTDGSAGFLRVRPYAFYYCKKQASDRRRDPRSHFPWGLGILLWLSEIMLWLENGEGGERNWGWIAGSVFLIRDTSMVLDLFGASWASLDSPFCLNTMQCYYCLVETVGSA